MTLVTALQVVVEQLGLRLADPPRHAHRGTHVGQRIVSLAMLDPVGGGEDLQAVYRQTLLVTGPLDALAAQRPRGAHQVDEVPA